ncbi:MAG: nitrogen fixation protein [gamma proteobacterium symbiont of Bathyaustriella thionipta]|nr:nitrogen fixation protein [gamma proteobacterium symbiont of Bathyaustriella thionipta]
MKIAVTSQNKKTVTQHAGRCRKFWIFEIQNHAITDKSLLELTKDQSFHDSSPHQPHPLDNIDLLITAGMGQGLVRRLQSKGIKSLISHEKNPEKAVFLYLQSL